MRKQTMKTLTDTMETDLNPAIQVTCLSAYSRGYLHNCWIDAAQDPKEIHKKINYMLAKSPAPGAGDRAIHGYEGFGPVRIDEFEDVEFVSQLAQFIKKHGQLGAYLFNHCYDLEEAKEALRNNYMGEYESESDFAECLVEEFCGQGAPDSLFFYIDYERLSNDLFIDSYFSFKMG